MQNNGEKWFLYFIHQGLIKKTLHRGHSPTISSCKLWSWVSSDIETYMKVWKKYANRIFYLALTK